MTNAITFGRKKKQFKRKQDQSHLLSLTSMKLNQKRDRNAYLLKRTNKSHTSDDSSSSSSVSSFSDGEKLTDRVRQSLGGRDIDDSIIWKFANSARDDQGINPYEEFEEFLYYFREQMGM